MNEERRIKRVLLRNTALFFVVFALIFAALGIFTYSAVKENMYRAADNQLTSIDTTYPFITQNDRALANTTNAQPLSGIGNEADAAVSIDAEPSNDAEVIADDGGADAAEATTDPDGAAAQKADLLDGYGMAAALSSSTIEENIQEYPQTIYVFRDASGAVSGVLNLYSAFQDVFSTLPFDENRIDTVSDIEFDGHSYRTLTRPIQILTESTTFSGGDTASSGLVSEAPTAEASSNYLQMLVNVDAEITMLEQFTQTLILGLALALVVCAGASYLLSRKTTKPIMQAWKRQTEFVQNASHELRTPLTVIHTTQELMLENPNAKIIDHLEDVSLTLEETDRLSKLAEELLLLTSIDAGKMKLDKQNFDLDRMIEDTATLFEDYAASQDKSFTLDLSFGRMIEADRDRIRQVLSALLDNALKYTEPSDAITLCSRDGGKNVIITIADTGIGIADEDQERIFDRFYRADKARTRTGKGVGLGLSIASSIVEEHGGTIILGRNEPKGTVVAIELPS